MTIARSIIVIGHVQGVFFREWAVRVANELGVKGWVRNRKDGSVEVYAAGQSEQLDRFIAELRNGSPAARVDELVIEEAPVEPMAGFLRRSTL